MSQKTDRFYRPVKRLEQPIRFLTSVVSSFVESNNLTDAEDALKLIGLLRNGSFGAAVRVADAFTKQSYGDAHSHYVWHQLAALVRKCPIPDPSLQPEEEAWKKFLASEHNCRRVNSKLLAERRSGREKYSVIRDLSRKWISKVIGREPNLRKIYERCGFGPGASLGVHGEATHLAAKLCAESWTCTPTATQYAQHAMMGEPLMWEYLQNRSIFCLDAETFVSEFNNRVKHVAANKITMVPKTALVHRTIAIEPTLNGYIQKGIDVYLRKKLNRVGIDLSDQDTNSFLAMRGSVEELDPLCTIDLSAASDSISIQVCKDLLPPAWFDLMDRTRSPSYESTWGSGRYHKFVSMGNGFCFPLETLIFASLAYAVGEVSFGAGDNTFRVYGDDIVIRQHAALLLLEVLKYLGFKANASKTFVHGPFRESCGADYFVGVNVRPYELDFVPETDRDLIKFANGIRSSNFLFNPKVWETIHKRIDSKWKFLRPSDGPADAALTVPLPMYLASSQRKWCPRTQNWIWKSLVDKPIGDQRRVSTAISMYGVLAGSRSYQGQPIFTLRRRTRTRVVTSTTTRAA